MENIKNSSFAKFEGNEITSFRNFRDGEIIYTGSGAGQAQNGDCYKFTSDEIYTITGGKTFCGVKVFHDK